MTECPMCYSAIAEGRCSNANCGYAAPIIVVPGARSAARRRLAARRAIDAKNDAMERADAAADARWKALADAAIVEVARSRDTFTADDVWALLDSRGVARPPEARALGTRMSRAAKLGLIKKDAAFVPSARAERHAAPIQKWRSVR